jgi:hypothetical protein
MFVRLHANPKHTDTACTAMKVITISDGLYFNITNVTFYSVCAKLYLCLYTFCFSFYLHIFLIPFPLSFFLLPLTFFHLFVYLSTYLYLHVILCIPLFHHVFGLFFILLLSCYLQLWTQNWRLCIPTEQITGTTQSRGSYRVYVSYILNWE